MSQPLDRSCTHPQLGDLDQEAGEFWIGNPFEIVTQGENLSAYERNCLFLNFNGEQFIDGSFSAGADIDSDSRSVVATDFDNNGSIDLLVGSVGGGPLRLFRNTAPQGNRLRVALVGTSSNRQGIGSRIVAQVGGRQIVRDIFPANGFMGQGPQQVDLGVGSADYIERLTVRWPSGKLQTIESVAVDSPLTLVEPESEL